MSKNLITGIAKWLNEGGYPLELYATKTLREIGYQWTKSPLYKDAESGKPREIDIIAEISAEENASLTLKLIIECKKTAKPFVVLCDTPAENTILKGIFSNLQLGNVDHEFVGLPMLECNMEGFSTPILNTTCNTGYTLLQAHQSSDSNIYSEVYKLAKAYYCEIENDSIWRQKTLDMNKDLDVQDVYFAHVPILLVDAPLVDVYIDDFGDTKIIEKKISLIRLQVPSKFSESNYPSYQAEEMGVPIAIVTKEIFVDLAKDFIVFVKEIVNRQHAAKRT